jgi:drug/metabolite transporter (DMT)-like permease
MSAPTLLAWVAVLLLTVLTGMLAHGCITFAQRLIPVATAERKSA